jgi:hypothetical protein
MVGGPLQTTQGSLNYGLITLQLGLSYMARGTLDWKRRFVVAG